MYFMGKIRAGVAGAHKKSKSKTHKKKSQPISGYDAHLLGARDLKRTGSPKSDPNHPKTHRN